LFPASGCVTLPERKSFPLDGQRAVHAIDSTGFFKLFFDDAIVDTIIKNMLLFNKNF
jgi:hypothetical protein